MGGCNLLHGREAESNMAVTETRRITPHFDGKVIAIDTGMLDGTFFPNGQPSALEIKDGTMTAIYIGKREPITVK